MPRGKLTMRFALKNHITIKILVPDYGTTFSQLVKANTNRYATLIGNLTKCKQNVYFRFVFLFCLLLVVLFFFHFSLARGIPVVCVVYI